MQHPQEEPLPTATFDCFECRRPVTPVRTGMKATLMPAQHTLHVAVTEPLLRFVNEQIASGRYATASELVRAALRLLMDGREIERQRARVLGADT
jgi:putative addiction module CopG family antidote